MPNAKHIVITGVSRGLGRALVDELIRLGHTLAGCCRTENAVEQLAAQHPEPHHFAVCDVSDPKQVAAWAQQVLAAHGPPDLLLNNAALMNATNTLWQVPPGEFSRLMDVNIKGVFYVIRYFLPAMIERGTGVVVNFSSGWGRGASPEVAPYCTTKWAVEGLTRALASELPRDLAAVALNPGIIHTEMLESCFGAHASAYPTAETWARTAAPFILSLGPRDNGEPLTVELK